MQSRRTTLSGQGYTLITGLGGRPVDRNEVESWCRTRSTESSDSSTAAHSRRQPAAPLLSA